jgi:hypothetical protein
MKPQSHDLMLALCLVSVATLCALGKMDSSHIMTVIAGILGYATRATVSK